MSKKSPDYIPALRYDWLTFLYDPLLQFTLREYAFKRSLIAQATIEDGQQVLDLGCGTATLTLLIKQASASVEVDGLDADAKALAIAQSKLARAHTEVTLTQGLSDALPYPDQRFDRVLSSLFFHHLTRAQKMRTFEEVFRVLRPGGQLHIADWGKAQDGLMRFAFLLVQLLDGFETTAENVQGSLPDLCHDAGFQDVRLVKNYRTLFGTLSLYRAQKPL